VREAATICPRLARDLDLRPFDVECGVRVTCDVATYVPTSLSLGLPVLDLGPMYATDLRRQTDKRQIDVRCQTASSLNAPSAGYDKRCNTFCFGAVAYTTLDRLRPMFTFC